ncbi:MAG: J domain-containing protein [Bryobacteraceae bacterium]
MRIETRFDPWEVLGLDKDATPEQAREAYLRLVKSHPPESDPEAFERIRDAFDEVSDPRKRTTRFLEGEPKPPLASLLDAIPAERKFTGPKAWLAVVVAEAAKRP